MLNALDNFFLSQQEPTNGCLLFLREYILSKSEDVTEHWKYGLPFYYYQGKMWCYLWIHKKHKMPYIGFVDGDKMTHPDLIQEKRARMKIYLIDPTKDIAIKKLNAVFKEALTEVQKQRVWLRKQSRQNDNK